MKLLTTISLDYLKIDVEIIRGMAENSELMQMMKIICCIAPILDIKLVAEGVETQAQYDCVKDAGCTLAQGYHFFKPLPVQDLNRILSKEE